MIPCEFKGCDRTATHALRLIVPAAGWPEAIHRPLSIIIGLKLCREHADAADVKQFMDDELRATIRNHLAAGRKEAPDFERARSEPVRLEDSDYLEFERMQAGRSQ